MPEEKYPTPEVNLLSEDELNNTAGGKFIKWALTWGRRIIVLTELVVISAFLSRFWLDTTVANNNEIIDQKRAVVVSMAEFEKKYRTISNSADEIRKIEKEMLVLKVYDQAMALIPLEVKIQQINISPARISFNGVCSERILSQMANNFRQSTSFSAVTVERVATDEKAQDVNFSFIAEYAHR